MLQRLMYVDLNSKYNRRTVARLLFNWQLGKCSYCHKPMKLNIGPFQENRNHPVIDHDHATGLIRALIHDYCNLTIAAVESNDFTLGAWGISNVYPSKDMIDDMRRNVRAYRRATKYGYWTN